MKPIERFSLYFLEAEEGALCDWESTGLSHNFGISFTCMDAILRQPFREIQIEGEIGAIKIMLSQYFLLCYCLQVFSLLFLGSLQQ